MWEPNRLSRLLLHQRLFCHSKSETQTATTQLSFGVGTVALISNGRYWISERLPFVPRTRSPIHRCLSVKTKRPHFRTKAWRKWVSSRIIYQGLRVVLILHLSQVESTPPASMYVHDKIPHSTSFARGIHASFIIL
jgi:hypothetical protein